MNPASLLLALMPIAATSPILSNQASVRAADLTDPDPAVVHRSAEALRALGPRGLEAALRTHQAELDLLAELLESAAPVPDRLVRLRLAIERIAAQRDGWMSGLYWYTDLDRAIQAAEASGRPILSLRLLGRLDEELSCANSRYFRSVLYANREISEELRKNYVLHWESVRPIPRVTVDFGDGRTMERTITGNSVHYLLTPSGRFADALPGLYGPRSFKAWLSDAGTLARTMAQAPDPEAAFLAHHEARRRPTALVPLGIRADEAATLTVSKMRVEAPLLTSVLQGTPTGAAPDAASRPGAEPQLGAESLDASSRRLLTIKVGGRDRAASVISEFERELALESTRNESTLHQALHQWFATEPHPSDLAALTDRIYDELFRTPSSDPWLGLLVPNAYSAIEREGIRQGG